MTQSTRPPSVPTGHRPRPRPAPHGSVAERGGPRITADQRQEIEGLDAEWRYLDRQHGETLAAVADGQVHTRRLADIRARMRYVHWRTKHLRSLVVRRSAGALEAERLRNLRHEQQRASGLSAVPPFLHTDRWWEPGYVPDGAENLTIRALPVPR